MNNDNKAVETNAQLDTLEKRMADGSINEQSVWQYLTERCSAEEGRELAVALIDCTREYTYEQMFAEWYRYARVLTALDITEANHSRVAIAGTISAEPLFAFYAANMTGVTVSMMSYPDFLPAGHWKTMIEKEKITDLIISDLLVMPDLWREIEKEKEALGLRNVILVHSRLGGPCVGPAELLFNEFNYHALKRMPGAVFMDDLLQKYAEVPIVFGSGDGDQIAIITHTSGTTKGMRKPLPYTNRAVNTVATNFKDGFSSISKDACGQMRVAPSFDFSSFLCMCGLINANFVCGQTIVLTCFGFLHPKFVRAVEYYRLNVMFVAGFMMDQWMKRADLDGMDFSSLKVFACGGSFLPPVKLKKYAAFMKKHGYRYSIFSGYGMSETGGIQLCVSGDCGEDVLGYPEPKEYFLIQDEVDGKYFTADDGERTGVLYVTSDSMCRNELDGEKLFDFTEINGRNFVCTNDLIHVNKTGSFSYAGRADRFFVNNDGVRFEAGIVETTMSLHPAVHQCAIVPVLDKRIHDTVPVLYVIPTEQGTDAPERIRSAMAETFLQNKKLEKSSLPTQLVLVDHIPCNSNGKIDIFRITRERLQGDAYNIIPARNGEKLIDIKIEKAEQINSITGGTLPEGMEGNSAFGIFEMFNTVPEKRHILPRIKLPKIPFIEITWPEKPDKTGKGV